LCYEGSAGALGLKEDVKVKISSFASGKGTMDLSGSGIETISCTGKSFSKSGQDILPDISDCLPKVVTVQKVEYCSDDDTVSVTVKDTNVPIPVSASLKKVTCPSTDRVESAASSTYRWCSDECNYLSDRAANPKRLIYTDDQCRYGSQAGCSAMGKKECRFCRPEDDGRSHTTPICPKCVCEHKAYWTGDYSWNYKCGGYLAQNATSDVIV
jgi:hypothetical protein